MLVGDPYHLEELFARVRRSLIIDQSVPDRSGSPFLPKNRQGTRDRLSATAAAEHATPSATVSTEHFQAAQKARNGTRA